ncbi:metal-dependent hydrolase [Halorubrum sp. Hd13]|uniref:metal-dependent hydrolase n=1 Tax=Halorubrum sp. Hd13 TaxID=1480728 RepID=UPI000B9812E6|nr:metal-dependent hydrolase [Halorubrum sp. Hd13]OYR43288.1 metal-dependent hydrolase [Halorubrum sp. Hd13]
MLFATHLLVAAGLGWLSGHPRLRRYLGGSPPLSVWWLVAGAALPDVVDKPLGALGVFDVYQSVGHSALLVPLAALVAVAARRRGLAVAVGWGSHLALDALHMVVNGRPGDAAFLGWPLLTRSDPLAIPPGEFALFYVGTPSFFLEAALWLAAVSLVLRSRVAVGTDRESGR